jgi:hypothetical protein
MPILPRCVSDLFSGNCDGAVVLATFLRHTNTLGFEIAVLRIEAVSGGPREGRILRCPEIVDTRWGLC